MNEEGDINIGNNIDKAPQSVQNSKTHTNKVLHDAEISTWSKYEMFFFIISYTVMFLTRLGKDLFKSVLDYFYSGEVTPEHILDLMRTSKELRLENNLRKAPWIRHLNWMNRIKFCLRYCLRAFKCYVIQNEDDTSFRLSRKVLSENKNFLFPNLVNEPRAKCVIIEAPTISIPSSENTEPSTSKKREDNSLANELNEAEFLTKSQDINIDYQSETITFSNGEDDDSIVVAYLKEKDVNIDVESLLAQLSESSLDVHIPSFPGSPRSLNLGSVTSIETIANDPFFADAINFLHVDKEFLIAAATGNHKILELLIRQNANIHQKDHLGRNALHLAVCSGREAAITLLLKTEININVQDNLGMTALTLCLMRRPSYKIANLLFEHGAVITPRSNSVDTGLFIQFVMMCEPTQKNVQILQLLVDKGAIVNDPEAPGGRQALHFAAMSNNCILIRVLVKMGADIFLTNHRKETPKKVAQIFKCREAYELLSDLEQEHYTCIKCNMNK